MVGNKEIKIIIATHGGLAEGIIDTGSMMLGDLSDISCLKLEPSESPEKFQLKLKKIIDEIPAETDILFMVDIWGGTPCNQILLCREAIEQESSIISGLNLPLLIEAYSLKNSFGDVGSLATQLYKERTNYIDVNEENRIKDKPMELKEKNNNQIKEGKVEIVLCRIDSRLLHGQVATTWTRETKPNRIIIVSDSVAKDDLRRRLLEQAAPPGVKVNVITIDKLVNLLEIEKFGQIRILVLFEKPQDLLVAINKGAQISDVNLGSMAHSQGKVMVNNAISMDKEDVETINLLRDMEINFDIRKVPSDSKESIEVLINKAEKELTK